MKRPRYFVVVVMALLSVTVAAFSEPQPSRTPAGRTGATADEPTRASQQKALPMLDEKTSRSLALQVALDRAGFSPGEIDGLPGTNSDRALAAFRAARNTGEQGDANLEPLVDYTITPEDVAGPFVESIPEDMMQKAKLPMLAYTSVLEMLAERFHASPKLLQRLNPTATFAVAETILVPNVTPFIAPHPESRFPADKGEPAAARPRDLVVTVTDRTKSLEVRSGNGEVIFYAPVTTGSQNDPLPIGEWVINGIGRNPYFNYNPDLFWDANPQHAKARLPAGPNNPVGIVWIDISKEHYGIHGTPEPSRIGYTESHGCIRLTNWDAMRLADLVGKGTKVVLR